MSNTIQFLELLGSKPALSPADYAATIAALDFDIAHQQVLLQKDPQALNDLLGGRMVMAMFVATPDGDDEPQESPDQSDDDGAGDDGASEPDEKSK